VNGGGSLAIPPVVATFLADQKAWVDDQIAQNPKSDYWAQVQLVYGQVRKHVLM
jgi:hypothetical protein